MEKTIYQYSRTCGDVTEWFVTAVPDPGGQYDVETRRLYQEILALLEAAGAHLFQERVFATGQVDSILRIRREVLGSWADDVQPSVLLSEPGEALPIRGIQVHAIAGVQRPEVLLSPAGVALGRRVQSSDCQYVGLSAVLPTGENRDPYEQARSMFQQCQTILKTVGGCFLNVPRTWLWLRDVLAWYDELNRARNTFFKQVGLLGDGVSCPMPASTGIGLAPGAAGEALCSMDLTAVLNSPAPATYAQAGGKQLSAYDYGSAFSRAAQVMTPGGTTTFVSGTASIDKAGRTTHIGDADAQIRETILNVKAVLADMHCGDGDVVQVMAYCKTPAVQERFEAMADRPDWPWITLICDVCRDDLLFEIEALACQSR